MITLEGKVRKSGVAVAIAAVIDSTYGISSVFPALLEQGMKALKSGENPSNYPEAILVCENVAMSLAVKLPGISPIGIAAQSHSDIPRVEFSAPCVIGLPNLLSSISEGDILIVDGYKGIVIIDPDPQTLIRYQQIEQERSSRSKVFISSEHIPAKTQAGDIIRVYAHVFNEADVQNALSMGTDGLLVDLRGNEEEAADYYGVALRDAAGKPVAFAVEYASDKLLRAVMRYATPNQVSLLFPIENFNSQSMSTLGTLEDVKIEAVFSDLDPPQISFGKIACASYIINMAAPDGDEIIAIDLCRAPETDEGCEEMMDCLPAWVGTRTADNSIVILESNIGLLECAVMSGAKSVAVTPDIVAIAKNTIRSIGLEDEQ